jgi:hypothetical protein
MSELEPEDNVIMFPGFKKNEVAIPPPQVIDGQIQLSQAQQKAMNIIISGMPFVVIGIYPIRNGADIFSSLGGNKEELIKAYDKLGEILERAYEKENLL